MKTEQIWEKIVASHMHRVLVMVVMVAGSDETSIEIEGGFKQSESQLLLTETSKSEMDCIVVR